MICQKCHKRCFTNYEWNNHQCPGKPLDILKEWKQPAAFVWAAKRNFLTSDAEKRIIET